MSRDESIKKIISERFKPTEFLLENESHMHSGPRTESHYKICVVSDVFDGLSRVERQRLVNHSLKEEFNEGLHALTMRLKTPKEIQKKGPAEFASPDCSSKN